MADKVKKKKVKKEEKAEEEAPPPPPAPAPEPEPAAPTPKSSTRTSKSSKKKAIKRTSSNVFSMFSTQQVCEFKEGFGMMDVDKDGILGKEDLRATWDQVGKLVTDKELEDMLAEAPGPINFTQLLSLFAARMSGGSDDDETVRNAFMAFDENGKIDSARFKYALLSWGDRFTPKEVAESFDVMEIDKNGMIDTEDLIQTLVSGGDED
ncbi:myosin regulatory light chain 2-like [Planococcus citri]|uniref:myosin regulatory light chain 2-like n=1 Tax=Planococcus citri TaxID=170843 RepID=UPI0031FA339F